MAATAEGRSLTQSIRKRHLTLFGRGPAVVRVEQLLRLFGRDIRDLLPDVMERIAEEARQIWLEGFGFSRHGRQIVGIFFATQPAPEVVCAAQSQLIAPDVCPQWRRHPRIPCAA